MSRMKLPGTTIFCRQSAWFQGHRNPAYVVGTRKARKHGVIIYETAFRCQGGEISVNFRPPAAFSPKNLSERSKTFQRSPDRKTSVDLFSQPPYVAHSIWILSQRGFTCRFDIEGYMATRPYIARGSHNAPVARAYCQLVYRQVSKLRLGLPASRDFIPVGDGLLFNG